MFGPGLSSAVSSFWVGFAEVLHSIYEVFVYHLFQPLKEGKENALVLVSDVATWSMGPPPPPPPTHTHNSLSNGEQKKTREGKKWEENGRDLT